MDPLPEQPVAMDSQVGATELPQSGAAAVDPPQQQRAAMDFQREASDLPQSVAAAASAAMDSSQQRLAVDPLPQRAAMEPPLQRAAAGMELPQRSPAVDPQRGVMDVPQKQPPPPTAIDPQKAAIDLQREKEEKAAMRRRRQQGVLAGAARFAQLEQALQEIRVNALQVGLGFRLYVLFALKEDVACLQLCAKGSLLRFLSREVQHPEWELLLGRRGREERRDT